MDPDLTLNNWKIWWNQSLRRVLKFRILPILNFANSMASRWEKDCCISFYQKGLLHVLLSKRDATCFAVNVEVDG